MTDYQAIFKAVEDSMYAGNDRPMELRRNLAWTHERTSEKKFDDEWYFQQLLIVTFASGFNAATAYKFNEGLRKHFPNIDTSATFHNSDIDRIIASGDVIQHRRKLEACANNARAIQEIAKQHHSLQQFIDSYKPTESFENLMLLNEALRAKFDYISHVTVYHLMTDAGLPVLKPDLAVTRVFQRLGLIESQKMELHAIQEGRKFAAATGHTIRYVDAVFANYGQKSMWNNSPGICVDKPKCQKCLAQRLCQFYTSR